MQVVSTIDVTTRHNVLMKFGKSYFRLRVGFTTRKAQIGVWILSLYERKERGERESERERERGYRGVAGHTRKNKFIWETKESAKFFSPKYLQILLRLYLFRV